MTRLALILLLIALPAQAQEIGWATHDGDTTRAIFRIANVDAPEIDGKCDAERKLAIKAREFTRAWLAKGRVVIVQDVKRPVDRPDRGGKARILATFSRDGEDLGEALIATGLARPWKGRREVWC